jgi:predicted secreted protein
MGKASAFGTLFYLGTCQVMSQTVTGIANHAANITMTITDNVLAGSPLDVVVDLAAADSVDAIATKVRTHYNAVAAITAKFTVGGSGPVITLTRLLPAANDAACAAVFVDTGTTDATMAASAVTTAGAAFVAVANVKSITGPSLKLDTVDVTTHDSTLGWEEAIGTVLREGEVKVELEYDPADDTQDATAVGGLAYCLKNKLLKHFKVTWPGPVSWTFPGYVVAFEPSGPHDKDLTATVSIRIAGAPVIA